MFRRRKHPRDWTSQMVLANVGPCFVTDPDQPVVKAAVVLHQNPDLLPKDMPISEFLVACFDFDEDDRVALYMEGNPACLYREMHEEDDRARAETWARDWVGEPCIELAFQNIPAIYQGAFWALRGQDYGSVGALGFWGLPPAENGLHPLREFPLPLKPSEVTPEPGEVTYVLMPAEGIRALSGDLPR